MTPPLPLGALASSVVAGFPPITDSFDRTGVPLGTTDTGQTWVEGAGGFGCTSNRAYMTTNYVGVAYVEVSQFDMEVTAKAFAGSLDSLPGVIAAAEDGSNYYLLRRAGEFSNNVTLVRYDGGTPTILASEVAPWTPGQSMALRVQNAGDHTHLTISTNDIERTTYDDYGVGRPTGTKGGIGSAWRWAWWDDFSITAP